MAERTILRGMRGLGLTLAATTGLTLSGCAGLAQAAGASKVAPDEFRVVSKAPLIVPPEYNIVPPTPGARRRVQLSAPGQAQSALFGGQGEGTATEGEKLFVAKAGGDIAPGNIREVVANDAGGVVYKNPGFADRILFWRDADPKIDDAAVALDPDLEARRLREAELAAAATGGDPVEIRRKAQEGGLKLPGL
ncbi:MAG: DUF3035 domain-containing protein [Maricaulaceae bacterium]